jgi:uncharacterized protein YeaO (DUF488 family)
LTLDTFVKTKYSDHTGINTNCYAAVLKKFKQRYPKALFEVVMRFPNKVGIDQQANILSPSPKLIYEFKYARISFKLFSHKFEKEIFSQKKAVNRLKILRDLSKTQEIFLVCCEVNDRFCHRSILKYFIENLDNYLLKWRWNK